MRGNLLVISGCMFSGKTLELIKEIEKEKEPYLVFSPIKEEVTSRAVDRSIPAIHVGKEMPYLISYTIGKERNMGEKISHVFIDEVSFYDRAIIDVVEMLLAEGINITVAGLDKDFRGKAFGPIGDLIVLSKEVRRKYGVCHKCKQLDASMTQRLLLDGTPAPFNSPLFEVEGETEEYIYECRCTNCYERPI